MSQRYAYFQHVDSSDNEQEVENNEMEVAEEALVYYNYQHKLYHPDDVPREESPTFLEPDYEVIIKGVKEKRPVFLNWL